MEKRGEIAPGWTPPENEEKQASADLESHVTKRAEDAAKQTLAETKPAKD